MTRDWSMGIILRRKRDAGKAGSAAINAPRHPIKDGT
jgi:hypothetical protein